MSYCMKYFMASYRPMSRCFFRSAAAKAGGRSMAATSFDGSHATISRCATRGREGGATRGRDSRATRGDATTNLHNETMRGRCNERMMRGEARKRVGGVTRGREGSATTGDSTTSWHDKMTRGQYDETTSVLVYIIPLILLRKLSE
jgi:hypothetical protein